MMDEYLESLPEGQHPLHAGKEPGLLGEYRLKLLNFLDSSVNYMPERLLVHFPSDSEYTDSDLLGSDPPHGRVHNLCACTRNKLVLTGQMPAIQLKIYHAKK